MRKPRKSSDRQKEIFQFIKAFLLEKGYPPSVREIGEAVGLKSSSTVHGYLSRLEANGMIKRDPTKPRAIDILDERPWRQYVPLPMLMGSHKGSALFSERNIRDVYSFPQDMLGTHKKTYLLHMPDDGLQEAGIAEGDVLFITPQEFVGNIMPLCQDLRGEYKNMQYLDSRLVELHYEMPLNEIVYNFFDTLKARTKGYASLDYEFSSYHPSELVKVDMLLNGDQVDALSFIAHKDQASGRARKLCEKLKENIPRQLFEIPVQAAIGGKIIARETVKALRKDVLAKCYGGDITRKKKLLEKQKEGKKKMRQLGTVQIPTEAFLAVLKLDE